jgi:hypothetical protein
MENLGSEIAAEKFVCVLPSSLLGLHCERTRQPTYDFRCLPSPKTTVEVMDV